MSANPLERLVVPNGISTLTPDDVLHRVVRFIDQCPGMGGIVVIGREGDMATVRCRPTRRIESSKIRDVLRFAILKGDGGEQAEDQHSPLVQVPGMRQWSLRETLQRIRAFTDKCPTLTMVLVLCRDNDLGKIQCLATENLAPDAVRTVLRNALISYDRRGLPPPAAA